MVVDSRIRSAALILTLGRSLDPRFPVLGFKPVAFAFLEPAFGGHVADPVVEIVQGIHITL
jgi:hypothetical protein